MKRKFLSALVAMPLLASSAFATEGREAAGVLPSTTTVCSEAVTLTNCQDPNFLACPVAQDAVHGCGPLVTTTYNTQYAATKTAANTKPILLPQPMLAQTAPTAPLGTLYNDALGTYGVSGTVTTAGTGASAGDDLLAALAFYKSNPLSTPRYSTSTQTMSSCEEYAWKKWQTYGYFYDVAASLGTNYEAIVAAASTPGGYDIAGNPVRSDGQSVTVNGVPLPSPGFQRNVFFSAPMVQASDSPYAAQINALIESLNPNYVGDLPSNVPWITTSDDFGFSTRTLAAHKAAGITDAHYTAAIARMQAYNALVLHYLEVLSTLEQLPLSGGGGGGGGGGVKSNPQVFAPRLSDTVSSATHRLDHLAPEDLVRAAAVVSKLRAAPRAQVTSVSCSPSSTSAICQRQVLGADLTATSEKISQALIAEWNFDANHGCLGQSFNGHALQANYCDWSPQLFADRYAGFEVLSSSAPYKRCIADTGDDFSIMKGTIAADAALQAKTWKDPRFVGLTYNDNLTHIENESGTDRLGNPIQIDFFDAYENRAEINTAEGAYQSAEVAQYNQVTADLPLTGPASSPTGIGSSMQDQNDIGGDWFGGGYSYTAAWSMTPHSQTEFGQVPVAGQVPQICRIDGAINGSLEAHATILKQRISLLDTALKAHTSPAHVTLDDAHLTVLGNDLFRDSGDWTGNTFNVPVDSTVASPSISVIIPILCIPVEVGAGASVTIGADTTLAASAPATCDINNLTVSMSGSVAPQLTVNASAWAGIDLVLVSAGIEGTINLITVQVPLTTSVSLASDPTGLALAVDTEADLNLSELSGHVDLYAEVDLGLWSDRADFQLFSWDGLHQTENLFRRNKHYPLSALNYVFFNQVAP